MDSQAHEAGNDGQFFAESPLHVWALTFHGAQAEQLGKALNVLVAYLAVILFTWLVKRFPRHHLVLIFGVVFSGLFLLYSSLIQNLTAPVVVSFFVWKIHAPYCVRRAHGAGHSPCL